MAFTEATLQAQIDGEGLGVKITQFLVGASYTDVYVQNYNETSRKSGWAQIANSRTAAQAETDLETALKA